MTRWKIPPPACRKQLLPSMIYPATAAARCRRSGLSFPITGIWSVRFRRRCCPRIRAASTTLPSLTWAVKWKISLTHGAARTSASTRSTAASSGVHGKSAPCFRSSAASPGRLCSSTRWWATTAKSTRPIPPRCVSWCTGCVRVRTSLPPTWPKPACSRAFPMTRSPTTQLLRVWSNAWTACAENPPAPLLSPASGAATKSASPARIRGTAAGASNTGSRPTAKPFFPAAATCWLRFCWPVCWPAAPLPTRSVRPCRLFQKFLIKRSGSARRRARAWCLKMSCTAWSDGFCGLAATRIMDAAKPSAPRSQCPGALSLHSISIEMIGWSAWFGKPANVLKPVSYLPSRIKFGTFDVPYLFSCAVQPRRITGLWPIPWGMTVPDHVQFR